MSGSSGATGLVGELMRTTLKERNFPVGRLRLFASARSAGKSLPWQGTSVVVEDAATADYLGSTSCSSRRAARLARAGAVVAAAGAIVIDNSSAWRMDPDVPLVVPR